MKKIIMMTVALTLFVVSYSFAAGCAQSGTAFTCDTSTAWTVNLSKNVVAGYTCSATPFTWYTLATGHTSGDKIYAASQADTQIFYKVDTTIVAADVLEADLTPAATSAYAAATTVWTAM
jgi:hypothetical protein